MYILNLLHNKQNVLVLFWMQFSTWANVQHVTPSLREMPLTIVVIFFAHSYFRACTKNVFFWRDTEHFRMFQKALTLALLSSLLSAEKWYSVKPRHLMFFSGLLLQMLAYSIIMFTMQSYYAHGGQTSHMTLCLINSSFSIKSSPNYYLVRQRHHSQSTKMINIRFALFSVQTHLSSLMIKAKNFKVFML